MIVLERPSVERFRHNQMLLLIGNGDQCNLTVFVPFYLNLIAVQLAVSGKLQNVRIDHA